MKEIGGYFELELNNYSNAKNKNDFFLNSGRHALEFILSCIDNINVVYLPFYTCDVVLQPLKKMGIKYKFYHINERMELEEEVIKGLGINDYIIINNFFGIKDSYIDKLVKRYTEQVKHFIVDCAQSLFYKNYNIPYLFYSPRKFVGVPDGGIAVINCNLAVYEKVYEDLSQNISFDKFSHLIKRIDLGAEAGYSHFRDNSKKISTEDMQVMSVLTHKLLDSIDFESIKKSRNNNFEVLHSILGNINEFKFFESSDFECALYYPLLISEYGWELRKFLIENKVYCPMYWPNVLGDVEVGTLEYDYTKNIVFIPIDQRYDVNDMEYIVETIKKVL